MATDMTTTDFDVLVVGSGIGGMESSLKLADMGYRVLLVEKESSVGGRMILLSKVFPTLDCASCISGPKMSSTINHPNITTLTLQRGGSDHAPGGRTLHGEHSPEGEVRGLGGLHWMRRVPEGMHRRRARPVQRRSGPRRAAYIAFPQAVPKKAVLQREGTSPCIGACPAGIKAHGYVSLVRSGKYEEHPAGARRHPIGRHPRARLLRPL